MYLCHPPMTLTWNLLSASDQSIRPPPQPQTSAAPPHHLLPPNQVHAATAAYATSRVAAAATEATTTTSAADKDEVVATTATVMKVAAQDPHSRQARRDGVGVVVPSNAGRHITSVVAREEGGVAVVADYYRGDVCMLSTECCMHQSLHGSVMAMALRQRGRQVAGEGRLLPIILQTNYIPLPRLDG